MRRYGAFAVPYAGQERFAKPASDDDTTPKGFPTPSKRLEVFSPTLRDWSDREHAMPGYIRSHVHWRELEQGERVLLPTFRLPTLIHTRSGNAKWLQEISHTNPLWVHPEDAALLQLRNGELARVETSIGWFVPRVWITEGIRPGVVACSHHVGRWRIHPQSGEHLSTSLVDIERDGTQFRIRQKDGVRPFASDDRDSSRIWWKEVGVNQNLTFPVQPDPVSGMHCWHQKVRVRPAESDDRYGDISVDTARSQAVFKEWLERTQPAPGPGGLRRPTWLNRPLHPVESTYKIDIE